MGSTGEFTLNENLYRLMRIPPRYWRFNADHIKHLDHWDDIKIFKDNLKENMALGKGLMLSGNYSTGKSSIAAAMLVAALEHKKIGMWTRMDELSSIQINNPVYDLTEGIMLWDYIETCPLLVIDDLFFRTDLKYSEELCEVLVRRRVDSLRSTIITTNRSFPDINTKIPSLANVMHGNFKVVKVGGYDFRADPKGLLK